jgi:hypothetical protein
MPDVYRQVHIMLKQRVMSDPISTTSPESQEKDRLIRELIALMPDEMLSREQTKPQGISFLDVQPRSVG